jgi:hypothetical protein
MNLTWTKFKIPKNLHNSIENELGIDCYYISSFKAGPINYEILIQHIIRCNNGTCDRYLLNIFILQDKSITVEKLQSYYLGAWEGHAFTLSQVKEQSKKILYKQIQNTVCQLKDILYRERKFQ